MTEISGCTVIGSEARPSPVEERQIRIQALHMAQHTLSGSEVPEGKTAVDALIVEARKIEAYIKG